MKAPFATWAVLVLTMWTGTAVMAAPRIQGLRPAGATSQRTHVAVLSGSIDILDDENWPETDERRKVVVAPANAPIIDEVPTLELLSLDECAGDEVRVTVDLDASVLSNGNIHVSGIARLYEGTDCGTEDLEKEKTISQVVLAGETVPLNVDLKDSSGSAKIRLMIGNRVR